VLFRGAFCSCPSRQRRSSGRRGQGRCLGTVLLAGCASTNMAIYVHRPGRGVSGRGDVGLITIGVLALFVAAVVVPPFSGAAQLS